MDTWIKYARTISFCAFVILAVYYLRTSNTRDAMSSSWTRSCTEPVGWYIGEIDERFGFSHAQVLEAAELAAAVWNADRPRRPYFVYDASGTLPIHLKYDHRVNQIVGEQEDFQRLIAEYHDQLAAYNDRLEKYEADLKRFNEGRVRGHRNLDRMRLNRESEELQREQQRLAEITQSLEQQKPQRRGVQHLHIGHYQRQVLRSRGVERIVEEQIFIMQASDFEELVLVLAHELGHSLGVEHVDDAEAVMHPYGTVPPHGRIRLTPADREALRAACRSS